MATTSNRKSEITIFCNAKQATDELSRLKQQLKESRAELERLVNEGKTGSERFVELDREVKNLSKTIRYNEDNLQRIDAVLNNLSNSSLRQVTRAYRDLRKTMQGMSGNDPALAQAQANLKKLREQMRLLQGDTERATGSMADGWKKTFLSVTSYMGVTALVGQVQSKMQALISLNLKYSDQLANIRKVSGLAARDVADLSKQLAQIDTRTTVEELATMAYEGAKLGFGDLGAAGLEGFVKAANQVNVALKEELGDEALTALSKMVDVMGLIPKMGVEQSLLATGSAMYQLAASSTASADQIVEFSKRLTGVARISGITTDQLLALGSASDSLALAPEVAATAFSKLITALQTNHSEIEKNLNIEPGTISKLYESGNLMEAIVVVLEKMKDMGGLNALNGAFKDLGSDGERLKTVLATMSQNVDKLRDHLQVSAEAFKDATAITNEYNIQQETAQAYMERGANVWEKSFVNPEGVSLVQEMAKEFYDVSVSITSNTAAMWTLNAAFKALILSVKVLLVLLPSLIAGLAFYGAIRGVGLLLGGIKSLATAIKNLSFSLKGLNAAAGIVGVAAALAMGVLEIVSAFKKSNEEIKKFNSSTRDIYKSIGGALGEARLYKDAIDNATAGSKERAAAIKNFNDKFGQYLDNMITERSTANEIAEAYARVNKQLGLKAVMEAKQKDLSEAYNPGVGEYAARMQDFAELQKKSPNRALNTTWLRGVIEDSGNRAIAMERLAKVYGISDDIKRQAGSSARNDDRVPDEVIRGYNTYSGGVGGAFAKAIKRDITDKERIFFAAARAVEQYYTNLEALQAIEKKYEPWAKELAVTLENPTTNPPLQDIETDEEKAKRLEQEKRERERAWRDELKQEQANARAVLDNIKNYYERQKTEMMRIANENGWDEQLFDSATDAIDARMNLALSKARKGIAGVSDEWEDFKLTMERDMIEKADELGYSESRVLLERIKNYNISALGQNIAALSDSLGKPRNSAIDAIWKNATLNEKNNESAEMRRQRERQQKLLADNYTGQVNRNYSESMTQLDFFELNADQIRILQENGAAAKALMEQRAVDIQKIFLTTRNRIADLANLEDVETEAGKDKLMTLLFGEDWRFSTTELKGVLDLQGEEVRLFYEELIKYSDDYTEAQKKAADRQKKLLDFRWENTDTYKNFQKEQALLGLAGSGVGSIVAPEKLAGLPVKGAYEPSAYSNPIEDDPEIRLYVARMDFAQRHYNFLRETGAAENLLIEAENDVLSAQVDLAEGLSENFEKRLAYLQRLVEPIEEFGTAMGKAFATMTEDAEEGRKAMKEAFGDMVNGFLEASAGILKEQIKMQLQEKIHSTVLKKQMKKAGQEQVGIEEDTQEGMNEAVSLGGEARSAITASVEGQVLDVSQTLGQELLQSKKTQTMEEVKTESQGTQAKVGLGIAGGAAKIIGSLGWWGIPLIAVITALLNGLLSFAMSKVSSLFGGGKSAEKATTTTPTKLVSGMLTYDKGNVQEFGGVLDGKTYPVVGNDGKVYAAKDGGELSTGLIKDPITTLVNGQPALVAERGPEIVIGRETTAAMMMARPDLLAEIVKFDRYRSGRTFRTYDEGNVSEMNVNVNPSGMTPDDVASLRRAINTLSAVASDLQKNGVKINKYGRGGLMEAVEDGTRFLKRNR